MPQMSVEMESSRALLAPLLELAVADSLCTQDPLCVRAVEVLRSWDARCAAESVGALLYERFRVVYLGSSPEWLVPFDLAEPLSTPRGIPPSEAETAVAALARVAREMEEEDGMPLDLAWGAYKKLPNDVSGVQWGLSGSVGDSVRTSGGESMRPAAGETTSTGVAGGTFKR